MEDKNIKKLWDKNQKRFITEFSIMQTTNSDGVIEHTYFERNKKRELIRLSTCHIEEINCTGKKDKNGKLMFEGDILLLKYHKLIGEIKRLDNGAFFINHKETNLKYLYQIHCEICETESEPSLIEFFEAYEIEIIGNIYENKQLLEGQ